MEGKEDAETGAGGLGRRRSHQVHRREGSKWIPDAAPITQRVVDPIRMRFDRSKTDNRYIEPNWKAGTEPRYRLHNYRQFAHNKVTTTKYTVLNFVFKNLYEQLHRWANFYFIGITVLNWIPALQAFSKYLGMIPIGIILALTALKDAFEDYRRHLADKRINAQLVHVWNNEFKRFRKMPWEHLIVGDLVHVSIDETIPADLLLLRSSDPQGTVFVETSNLDGENNLKQRCVPSRCRALCEQEDFDPTNLDLKVYCNPPDHRLNFVQGSVVYPDNVDDRISAQNLAIRGCQLRNTTYIEGIVLYAGRETKAMLNNGSVRYKRSTLERLTNRFVVFCVGILVLLFLTSGGLSINWLVRHSAHQLDIPYVVLYTTSAVGDGFINMASFIISYQILIPLSLYITVELIKLGQIFFLNQDLDVYYEPTDRRILCKSFTIPEELGQIEYVLSDKTGTLTENKMVFKYCAVNGHAFEPLEPSPNASSSSSVDEEKVQVVESLRAALFEVAANPEATFYSSQMFFFFLNMAICNTVMVHRQKHTDKIDQGFLEGDAFLISNSAFYVRPEEYETGSTEAPSGVSTTAVTTPTVSRFPSFILSTEIVRRLSSLSSSLFRREKKVFLRKGNQPRFYEAESPDEYCLVNAAKAYGFVLQNRAVDSVDVSLPGESRGSFDCLLDEAPVTDRVQRIKVLKVLPFDSTRKRMSVVVEWGGEKLLLCKGADDAIIDHMNPRLLFNKDCKFILDSSKMLLRKYASNGLRTLCMAKRIVPNDEFQAWLMHYEELEQSDSEGKDLLMSAACSRLEQNLEFLGLTAIEDRLQDGVASTISALRRAGIQVWVLTGDKEETALNIAKSCQLFDNETPVLPFKSDVDVAQGLQWTGPEDGATPEERVKFNLLMSSEGVKLLHQRHQGAVELVRRARAILCYRMTPAEKAQVVQTVKKALQGKVLAVGDGANDVPMIMSADVGIGISGQEGLQAVMASDFALARFRFLHKLLLVHGHWFYYRLANVLLYFLYKNAMFVFVLYWAQFFSGFSANGIMDPFYMMLYPIIFTSVQPLVYGIYDQDIDAETLMNKPSLYSKGLKSSIYKSSNFFLNMADALWQSAAIYFIALGTYYDTTCEAWEFGFLLASGIFFCNNVHLIILTRCWNWPVVAVHVAFTLLHYLFFLAYTEVTSPFFGTKSTPVHVAFHSMQSAQYWCALFVIVVVGMIPRFCFKVMQNNIRPGIVFRAALAQRTRDPSCLPACVPGCGFL